MKENAILTIDLPRHLEDYCRHELPVNDQGYIILNRKHDIGKHIYSHVLLSELPIKSCDYDNAVTFVIPLTSANRSAITSRFTYISKWGQQKIRDYVESEFNQRVRILFEAGYRKKYSQKEIIEAILERYNIKNTAVNYEAIKKSDYRHKKKTRKIIIADLETPMS